MTGSAAVPSGDPGAEFSRAYELEMAGDRPSAKALYEHLLALGELPDNLQAHGCHRLALIVLDEGDVERALQLFETASSTGDNNTVRSHALWHLAVTVLAQRPEMAGALGPRLLGYRGAEFPEPLMHLRGIECLAHLDGFLLPLDDIEAAFRNLPLDIDDSAAGAWVHSAFTLEQQRHLTAASAGYSELLRRPGIPEEVRANVNLRLGAVLDALGRWEESPELFRTAYSSPDASSAVRREAGLRLAKCLFLSEEYSGAAEIYRHLKDDDGLEFRARADAHLHFALCLLRLGELKDGVRELEHCTHEHVTGLDTSLRAQNLLAEIYERCREVQKAKDCYRRIIDHPASDPVNKTAALTRLRALG